MTKLIAMLALAAALLGAAEVASAYRCYYKWIDGHPVWICE
jgi:hypothetical protein